MAWPRSTPRPIFISLHAQHRDVDDQRGAREKHDEK